MRGGEACAVQIAPGVASMVSIETLGRIDVRLPEP
jgi:hypothetical protein